MAKQATSLKVPPELKARVAAAAKASGLTSHAFMVAAIERETARAEKLAEFLDEARDADREFERAGQFYEPDEVFRFLEARVDGKPVRRPKPKTWRG